MALVIAIEDVTANRSGKFVFARSPVHLGRSELNDLCLPLPFVSLFHGIVRFKDAAILYVDTGSKNGSSLDGARLRSGEPTPIGPGSVVTIGHLRLRLSMDKNAVPGGAHDVRRSLFGEQREQLDAIAGATRALAPAPVREPERERTEIPTELPLERLSSPDTPAPREPRTVMARVPRGPRSTESKPGAESAATESLEESASGPPPQAASAMNEIAVGAFGPQPPISTAQGSDAPVVRTEGVEHVLRSISSDYSEYRSKYSAMHKAIATQLKALSGDEQRSAFALLAARYPALLQEHQFRELAESHGQRPAAAPGRREPSHRSVIASDSLPVMQEAPAPARARDLAALKTLNEFAQAYAPSTPTLKAGEDAARFLDRVAQVLEAFAKAFVELRKGHDQFAAEFSVRASQDGTPLRETRSLQDVLRYLLEEAKGSSERVEQLTRAFAEVMIHQLALLNATRAGATGLLQQLSPDVLGRSGRSTAGFGEALFGRRNLWSRFVERHQELLEDEAQLSQALFGPEFARAYIAVAGGELDGDVENDR